MSEYQIGQDVKELKDRIAAVEQILNQTVTEFGLLLKHNIDNGTLKEPPKETKE